MPGEFFIGAEPPDTIKSRLCAWGVHFYTAVGALTAFLALEAIINGDLVRAFWWLAVGLAIDSSDGTLARALRVRSLLPQFDGPRLDDLVDYLNYVFVPVVLICQGGLLPEHGRVFVAAAPLLASAYGFCHKEAKTADNYFRGFPSYWNVVAFYIFALRPNPLAAAFLILLLSLLVFLPVRFIYPSRTPTLRWLTLLLGLSWAAVMILCLWQLPNPSPGLLAVSLVFPTYYVLLSLVLEARRLVTN